MASAEIISTYTVITAIPIYNCSLCKFVFMHVVQTMLALPHKGPSYFFVECESSRHQISRHLNLFTTLGVPPLTSKITQRLFYVLCLSHQHTGTFPIYLFSEIVPLIHCVVFLEHFDWNFTFFMALNYRKSGRTLIHNWAMMGIGFDTGLTSWTSLHGDSSQKTAMQINLWCQPCIEPVLIRCSLIDQSMTTLSKQIKKWIFHNKGSKNISRMILENK